MASMMRLADAVKERKVQEKLKEKAFEQFLQELNAQEMKEIDEVVSFNYNDREEDEYTESRLLWQRSNPRKN
mgnify:CR=1 FL=1